MIVEIGNIGGGKGDVIDGNNENEEEVAATEQDQETQLKASTTHVGLICLALGNYLAFIFAIQGTWWQHPELSRKVGLCII